MALHIHSLCNDFNIDIFWLSFKLILGLDKKSVIESISKIKKKSVENLSVNYWLNIIWM
jgi:hypothetical protein